MASGIGYMRAMALRGGSAVTGSSRCHQGRGGDASLSFDREHGSDTGLGKQQEGEHEGQCGRKHEDGIRHLGHEQRKDGQGRDPRDNKYRVEPRHNHAQCPRRHCLGACTVARNGSTSNAVTEVKMS